MCMNCKGRGDALRGEPSALVGRVQNNILVDICFSEVVMICYSLATSSSLIMLTCSRVYTYYIQWVHVGVQEGSKGLRHFKGSNIYPAKTTGNLSSVVEAMQCRSAMQCRVRLVTLFPFVSS